MQPPSLSSILSKPNRSTATDTVEGAAITGDSSGKVILWRYTSNPTGGVPGSPAEFESDECVNAFLSGSVDSGYDDVFLCE